MSSAGAPPFDSYAGISRHPRSSARLRTLIAEIGQRSGEFPVLLANHLPMVLEAIGRLGASPERLEAFAAHYNAAHAVPQMPPPIAALTRDTWQSAIGQRDRERDLRDFFAGEVAMLGGAEAIRRYMPALEAGVAASATHGLMRLAYAVLRRDETEIGISLGYWAATYLAFPIRAGDGKPEAAPVDLLLAMRPVPAFEGVTVSSTLLWKWIEHMGTVPEFQALLGRLPPRRGLIETLRQASLALYAQTMTFEALHAVTGCHWLRMVAPFVDEPERLAVYWWENILSLYTRIGMPALPDDSQLDAWRRLPLPPNEEIAAAAIASDDEHHHSLVFSAFEEYALTGDPLYKVVAARRVGLLA
jgi:hypothetical protein